MFASRPFELFGVDHLSVLALTLLVAVGLILALRRVGEDHPQVRLLLKILAWALLLSYPAKVIAFSLEKAPLLENALPMHLCNWAAILGFLALTTKRPLFCELLYFWGIAATLQALVTPNVPYAFPHPIFIIFFIIHSGVVVAALTVVVGMRRTPTKGGAWRAFLWAQVYLVVAGLTNLAVGTNYGFLRAKPNAASLLDHMGEWPFYILALEALALISFSLLSLPFLKKNRVIQG